MRTTFPILYHDTPGCRGDWTFALFENATPVIIECPACGALHEATPEARDTVIAQGIARKLDQERDREFDGVVRALLAADPTPDGTTHITQLGARDWMIADHDADGALATVRHLTTEAA